MKITTLHRYDKETDFHEQDIHPSLRDWISLWIGTGEKYIVQKDGSIILLQKFLDLLTDSSTSSTAIFAAERFFRFFFFSRNVILQEKQSLQYARFITQTLEIQKRMMAIILHHSVSTVIVDVCRNKLLKRMIKDPGIYKRNQK
jgi:hypothetical protein